jgi:hypothetical protein
VFLEGRRTYVRTKETNLGNLSTEANLWMAKFYDKNTVISMKNSGGIRSMIGYIQAWGDSIAYFPPAANPAAGKQQGDISQLDIENSLRFNNKLSLITVDATGLRRTLEHGVSATAAGATPGQFPQVAGVRFSFDPALPVFDPATGSGGRIRNAVVTNDSGTVILDTLVMKGALYGNPLRNFRLIVLNFIAGGGDGYPFPEIGSNRVNIDTLPVPPDVPGVANFAIPGSEQDAFAEYTKTLLSGTPYHKAETPVTHDYRIQNLSQRADKVFPAPYGMDEKGKDTSSSLDNAPDFVVHPNPTRGHFTIEQKENAGHHMIYIDIYGMQGNRVFSSQHPGRQKWDCNLESKPAGLYYIRINADGKATMLKLVVNR